MKRALEISVALLFLAILIVPGSACAQSLPKGKTDTNTQWVSHQMNQPLPVKRARYKMSQARLDDIKLLYEQAKKEIASKQSVTK
jgi:hypothetical protein